MTDVEAARLAAIDAANYQEGLNADDLDELIAAVRAEREAEVAALVGATRVLDDAIRRLSIASAALYRHDPDGARQREARLDEAWASVNDALVTLAPFLTEEAHGGSA